MSQLTNSGLNKAARALGMEWKQYRSGYWSLTRGNELIAGMWQSTQEYGKWFWHCGDDEGWEKSQIAARRRILRMVSA